MTPFEALYRCRYRAPLNWNESGAKVIFCPVLITEAEETVHCIQENQKFAKSQQESYANKRCQLLEFEVGSHIYMCV
jgi:hypothetical protein